MSAVVVHAWSPKLGHSERPLSVGINGDQCVRFPDLGAGEVRGVWSV